MTVLPLDAATDPSMAGVKAASLGDLRRRAFDVPDGLVVCVDAFDASGRIGPSAARELETRLDRLVADGYAVRSSSAAEDTADASYAGQYLTVLDVRRDQVLAAVERVHASAPSDPRAPRGAVAVLVQPMLRPRAAGVVFTADPVSGARDVVVIDAVTGVGDALVSGMRSGETWRRVAGRIVAPTAPRILGPSDAERIADVAVSVAKLRSAPQDVEWALVGETVLVLQARPMTALPASVAWTAPEGAFARTFRLGEWIGDPVTPLFESWLLTAMERTMHADYGALVGQPAPEPLHIVVNGWYYYSLAFLPASPRAMLRMLPGIVSRLPRNFRRIAPVFPPLARYGVDLYVREWREELLPAYREAVRSAEAALDGASPDEIVRTIERIAEHAGHYFTSITFVAGYGWKTEIPLARFYRTHLTPRIGGHPHELLRGLVVPTTPPYAVTSLDWYFPTLGELGPTGAADAAPGPALGTQRAALAERAREALDERRRARFDVLLAEAQRAAVWREEQVRELTVAWPYFRRALARLGEMLRASAVLSHPDDIHFITRGELASVIAAPRALTALAAERRRDWERQRKLDAPLTLGTLPRMLVSLLDAADGALRDPGATDGLVTGVPASPGRATGRVRVVRDATEFSALRAGEILVCRVTTPAWTPLFAVASGLVTDVGSAASHASIIAREYGIPAVVGTRDATSRLADGMLVTVDGSGGTVRLPG